MYQKTTIEDCHQEERFHILHDLNDWKRKVILAGWGCLAILAAGAIGR